MAAKPEPSIGRSPLQDNRVVPSRTAAILPLRRTLPDGRPFSGETPVDRLGPARGLILGVLLGIVLWLAIGLAAWLMLR